MKKRIEQEELTTWLQVYHTFLLALGKAYFNEDCYIRKQCFIEGILVFAYIFIIHINGFVGGKKDQWFHIDQAFGDSLVCFLAIDDYESPYVLPRRHTEHYGKWNTDADPNDRTNKSLMDYLRKVLSVCIYT